MNNTERNCDTCNDSYYMTEKNPSGGKKLVQLQHCRNTVYNSPAYTHQMLLEDWGKGFCRLWTPITEKGNEHEQQLYACAMCAIKDCPSQASGMTCRNGVKAWLLSQANEFFPAKAA